MRVLLAAAALAATPLAAQTAERPAHAVPFASEGNAVELELAAPDGAVPGGPLAAAVAEAPSWVRFHAAEVAATESEDEAVPVVRLAFDVARDAPVGEPAEVTFEITAGGVVVGRHAVRLEVAAPVEVALGAPYPNPAVGAVTVPFEVPEAGPVEVAVFDVLGRRVAVLSEGEHEPGAHEGRLPANALAAGTYVVRLLAGDEARVRTVTVVR